MLACLPSITSLTTQAQRPGARDATIATASLMPGSLQRTVRPLVFNWRKGGFGNSFRGQSSAQVNSKLCV